MNPIRELSNYIYENNLGLDSDYYELYNYTYEKADYLNVIILDIFESIYYAQKS